MRIVVVEDAPDVSALIAAILEPAGHTVQITDGPGALLYPAWVDTQVAVVDLMMPGVGGVEVLHFLRDRHPSVRRVVCSAITGVRLDILDLVDVAVRKPFGPEELLAAVTG